MLRWQLIVKCATNDVLVCIYLVRCILDVRIIEGKFPIKEDDVRIVSSPRVSIKIVMHVFSFLPDHRNRYEEWQSLRLREESMFGKLCFSLVARTKSFILRYLGICATCSYLLLELLYFE